MRMKTTAGWIFVGLGLLMLGQLLSMFGLTEDGKLAAFLFIAGLVLLRDWIIGGPCA